MAESQLSLYVSHDYRHAISVNWRSIDDFPCNTMDRSRSQTLSGYLIDSVTVMLRRTDTVWGINTMKRPLSLSNIRWWVAKDLTGRVIVVLISCLSIAGCSASFEIGPIEGRIKAPEGFRFNDYRIVVSWACRKGNDFAYTGKTKCGEGKSGHHIAEIAKNGRFEIPHIKKSRFSLFTQTWYHVKARVYKTGSEGNDVYVHYRGSRSKFHDSLQQLRLVRIAPGSMHISVDAVRGGKTIPFDRVKEWFPTGHNHRLNAELIVTSETGGQYASHPQMMSFPLALLSEGSSTIDSQDVVLVDAKEGDSLTYQLHVEAKIWLPNRKTETGIPMERFGSRTIRKAESPVREVNHIPSELLRPIELKVNFDEYS